MEAHANSVECSPAVGGPFPFPCALPQDASTREVLESLKVASEQQHAYRWEDCFPPGEAPEFAEYVEETRKDMIETVIKVSQQRLALAFLPRPRESGS